MSGELLGRVRFLNPDSAIGLRIVRQFVLLFVTERTTTLFRSRVSPQIEDVVFNVRVEINDRIQLKVEPETLNPFPALSLLPNSPVDRHHAQTVRVR